MKRMLTLLALLLFGVTAHALGPHEVLVLVNGGSSASKEVAAEFVRLRSVPHSNVVILDMPDWFGATPVAMSPADFRKLIWDPAQAEMKRRGIEDHILAWVYSVDFPVKISTQPAISIQGITFMKGLLPDPLEVKNGTHMSPMFAGPDTPDGGAHYPQTFDVYKKWLGSEMPLPSMMLGYIGERGSTKETVLKTIKTGVDSDGTNPTGTVFFVKNKGVRSRARQWEFARTARDLRGMGIEAEIVSEIPAKHAGVLGILAASPMVNPDCGNTYLPGAMADHLTSAAAAFDSAAQTKLTSWLDAGVTASAGTVTEPYAIWPKFPHARFFVHYRAGCTMMESLFQSIRSPFQILLVGEPLARPWAFDDTVLLQGLTADEISGSEIVLKASVASERHYGRFMFLVDGRNMGVARAGESFALNTDALDAGVHTLRVVGYMTGLIRGQCFIEKEFTVKR